MKYFIDTEFYEFAPTRAEIVWDSYVIQAGSPDLSTIPLPGANAVQLISIGVVAEDGREFYAENVDFDWDRVPKDHWLQDNVRPHLWTTRDPELGGLGTVTSSRAVITTPPLIANELVAFAPPSSEPEFWGYYCDYDWVVLCGLFGRMVDLPKGWPMYCRDLKQHADEHGLGDLPTDPQRGPAHHALADAREIAYRYGWCQ